MELGESNKQMLLLYNNFILQMGNSKLNGQKLFIEFNYQDNDT